jgi:hypothetical protein
MGNGRILARLVALVPPRLGASAEDVAQDALTRALEGDSALQGDALFTAASQHLERILKESQWQLRKGRVLLKAAKDAGKILEPVRRHQSPKRRLPKGVASARAFDSGFNLLPVDAGGDQANDRLRFAAAQLLAVDLPRLVHGEPYSPACGELLIGAYREIYGVEPQFHWAHLLIEEIERSKLQSLRCKHPDATAAAPSTTEVTLQRKRGSRTEAVSEVFAAEAVVVPSVPGRAVRHVLATIDGKKRLVGTELLTQEPEFLYPEDAVARSTMVLNIVRLRLAQLPLPQSLPGYGDNPLLVRWLFARLGFEGGGGQEMVKRETLLAWLTDPVELVAQVQRYGLRRSRSGTAAQGKMIKAELEKLVGEIKAQWSWAQR